MPEKLVRDRIPELASVEDFSQPVWRIAGSHEWDRLLGLKLVEETHEVLQALQEGSNDALIDELADLQTLIDVVAARRGISRQSVQDRVERKRLARGGFDQGVVLQIDTPRKPRLHVGGSSSLIDALRKEFEVCSRARIAVAFVMQSGLDLLEGPLRAALLRGAQIRLLTTDYLGVTQPQALQRLVEWSNHPPGRLAAKVYSHPRRSFHPKAWLFERSDGSGRAFIGSSNLSRSGLRDGVEWTWTVLDVDAGLPMDEIRARFDELFESDDAYGLDAPWIEAYAARRVEPVVQPGQTLTPRPVQQLALAELERLRADGETRALVVAATGLGKTFLAAFDAADAVRILFIAHREELLHQAARAFAEVYPDRTLGYVLDGEFNIHADCVFASIQTISREDRLKGVPPAHFDRIVIDEFHHAPANSYQSVIEYLRPRFLLGLTATPYRSDHRDLLELCHGNLAYQVGLFEAIALGWLVPFRYFGIADVVIYDDSLLQGWSAQAPEQTRKRIEREGRYDISRLTVRFNTPERAKRAIDAFLEHPSKASLGFCVSIDHARFMAEQFMQAGIPAAAVHSGNDSMPRRLAIDKLKDGQLKILFTVDLFNEGVDLPVVDLVMFLRPTESMTVFLQQLGRGLRLHEGKPWLTVLDFIGNYRKAEFKLPLLVGSEGDRSNTLSKGLTTDREDAVITPMKALRAIEAWQAAGTRPDALPEGIEIHLEAKAVEVLRESLRAHEQIRDQVIDDLQSVAARRPETLRMEEYTRLGRFSRSTVLRALNLRGKDGRWFEVLRVAGLNNPDGAELDAIAGDLLHEIESTPMTRSFKMVVLLALFEKTWRTSILLDDMVVFFRQFFSQQRHEADVMGSPVEAALTAPSSAWKRYLKDNPINAWVGGNRAQPSQFFAFEAPQETFHLVGFDRIAEPDLQDRLRKTLLDRIQARLLEYWRRPGPGRMVFPIVPLSRTPTADPQQRRSVCIMFGERKESGLPEGWHLVRINGQVLYGKFMKVALNVLKAEPSDDRSVPNRLTDELTTLFGSPPASRARVRLVKEPGAQVWEIQSA